MSPGTPRKRGRKANIRSEKGFNRQHGATVHSETTRAARRAEVIAARRQKAWALLVGEPSLTFEQIGQRLGVSNYTAWCDCVYVRDHLLERGLLDPAMGAATAKAQLDQVKAAHLRLAASKSRPSVQSARVVLETLNREARMLGYDRHRDQGYSAEQVLAELNKLYDRIMAAIPDGETTGSEVRRLVTQAVLRTWTPAALPAAPEAVETGT